MAVIYTTYKVLLLQAFFRFQKAAYQIALLKYGIA